MPRFSVPHVFNDWVQNGPLVLESQVGELLYAISWSGEFMTPIPVRFGFPSDASYRFRLRGRRYKVGSRGAATLSLLTRIHAACTSGANPQWAIRVRGLVRQVQTLNATATLTLVIERTSNPLACLLAIWLRGRCRGTLGTYTIAPFAGAADAQLRKEAVRALKRMEAWVFLREVAVSDPSPRIRHMATSRSSQPHGMRLAEFARHVSKLPSSSKANKTLWTNDKASDRLGGRPPKSSWFIRRLLEHIQQLVHPPSNSSGYK